MKRVVRNTLLEANQSLVCFFSAGADMHLAELGRRTWAQSTGSMTASQTLVNQEVTVELDTLETTTDKLCELVLDMAVNLNHSTTLTGQDLVTYFARHFNHSSVAQLTAIGQQFIEWGILSLYNTQTSPIHPVQVVQGYSKPHLTLPIPATPSRDVFQPDKKHYKLWLTLSRTRRAVGVITTYLKAFHEFKVDMSKELEQTLKNEKDCLVKLLAVVQDRYPDCDTSSLLDSQLHSYEPASYSLMHRPTCFQCHDKLGLMGWVQCSGCGCFKHEQECESKSPFASLCGWPLCIPDALIAFVEKDILNPFYTRFKHLQPHYAPQSMEQVKKSIENMVAASRQQSHHSLVKSTSLSAIKEYGQGKNVSGIILPKLSPMKQQENSTPKESLDATQPIVQVPTGAPSLDVMASPRPTRRLLIAPMPRSHSIDKLAPIQHPPPLPFSSVSLLDSKSTLGSKNQLPLLDHTGSKSHLAKCMAEFDQQDPLLKPLIKK